MGWNEMNERMWRLNYEIISLIDGGLMEVEVSDVFSLDLLHLTAAKQPPEWQLQPYQTVQKTTKK